MKIPLIITKDNLISTSATVRGPHIFGVIEVILDTGSPETIISEGDALKLNIPINKLRFVKHSYGLGGSPIAKYEMRDIIMYFKTDENKTEIINFPKIFVSRRTSQDERTRQIALGIPTILGNDFLLKNNFTLYFNPSKNIAHLEK